MRIISFDSKEILNALFVIGYKLSEFSELFKQILLFILSPGLSLIRVFFTILSIVLPFIFFQFVLQNIHLLPEFSEKSLKIIVRDFSIFLTSLRHDLILFTSVTLCGSSGG